MKGNKKRKYFVTFFLECAPKRKYNTFANRGWAIQSREDKNQALDAEKPCVGWPVQPEKKRGRRGKQG
jgi:hypothetical protein